MTASSGPGDHRSSLALVDFGSTFTKATLVDPDGGAVLGHGQAPTTVGSDLIEGLGLALADARQEDPTIEVSEVIAASSAAGGLRVAAIGAVEDLTAAAATQAALNAGARVDVVLSGRLGPGDLLPLERDPVDIVLFAGGTTGGQRDMVLANARALAAASTSARIVVACNDEIAEEVAELLAAAGKEVEVVANVMPEIFALEIEPARAAIARLFVDHVIGGKGLSRYPEFARMVKMPTPEAVLRATRLLSSGLDGERSPVEVAVVDVGGATTDVHSVTAARESASWLTEPLLPVLPVLRTVQGDLGMRWNAPGVAAADSAWLAEQLGAPPSIVAEIAARRSADPGLVAESDADRDADRALAASCISLGLRRHAGEMVTYLRPNDEPRFEISGPDLSEVGLLVATGGAVVRDDDGGETVARALARGHGRALVPRAPRVVIDRDYVLSAAGLLGERDPALALRLIRETFEESVRR